MVEVWGVPDWRDESAYPVADDLTLREWWWEFTRRRPDYRMLWMEACARLDPHEPDWHDARTVGVKMNYAGDDAQIANLRTKFGMSKLLDPGMRFSDETLGALGFPWPVNGFERAPQSSLLRAVQRGADLDRLIEKAETREQIETEAWIVRYKFSVLEPLLPQIERAKRELLALQAEVAGLKNTRRPRPSNWPLFLRALDAKDSGASLQDMLDQFWPAGSDGKTEATGARDTYKLACQLRDNFPI